MKKVILAVLMVGLVLSPFIAWSQTQSVKQEALSPEDAKQLRDQLQALAALLKSKVPEEPQNKSSSTQQQVQGQTTGRSVADVMDKALDLTSSSIAFIASKVEKAAPQVWRIMIFQQYAKAIGDLVTPWGLLLIVAAFYRLMAKKWTPEQTKDDEDDNLARLWTTRIIPIIAGFIFAIWGVANLSGSIKYLINPEYYAIKDLFGIVMGNVGM